MLILQYPILYISKKITLFQLSLYGMIFASLNINVTQCLYYRSTAQVAVDRSKRCMTLEPIHHVRTNLNAINRTTISKTEHKHTPPSTVYVIFDIEEDVYCLIKMKLIGPYARHSLAWCNNRNKLV